MTDTQRRLPRPLPSPSAAARTRSFGLLHASTYESGAAVEYGDYTDVMGGGSDPNATDFHAGYKHGANWIRNAWVAQATTLAGAQTRVFQLAAADRNSEAFVEPPAPPAGVRFAARAPIAPRPYMEQAESAFLYLTYRGQYAPGGATGGVFLNEMSFEPSNRHIGK